LENFNQLIQAQFGQLSSDELGIIRSYFHEEVLKKGDLFTQTDQICNRLSIIKEGLLRVYAYADGKDITQWISTPHYLITEIMGFFFDQPNRWNIQALTDTTLLTITKSNYDKLCDEIPKWKDIEKQFIVRCFATIEDRVFTHLSMTAAERYDLYYAHNQDLFNQVPLRYIASVLGMTPETFSRIRKQKMGVS